MIERWSEGIADDNMAEEILIDLTEIIHRHPWWQARATLTLDLLRRLGLEPPARILDVGCGWGVTLESLEKRGYEVIGMDISRRTLEKLDRPGRVLFEADLTRSIEGNVCLSDGVLALDVIEHIDDDRAAVERLGSLVRPGGVLVVSVPALPDMFSEFDAVQGHRRRYLPDTLRSAFADTGLDLERIFWWGRWLVPTLRRQRSKPKSHLKDSLSDLYSQYLRLPPWPLPWIARMAFALEQRAAVEGRLRTGTSLFAVARRPLSQPS